MDIEEYRRLFSSEDSAPGWDAIDSRLNAVYGDQEPLHWGTLIKYAFGGPDPLDGISAYENREGGIEHQHFCTYGYSNLYYDEESAGGEHSGFGFEMTFRLATPLPPTEQPNWVLNMLNNLARYVFDSKKWFAEYHWIPANGPIREGYPTEIVGFAFLLDPQLPPVDSPHGRVEFVQGFGITTEEIEQIKDKSITVKELIEAHQKTNPLLVTDLDRRNL